MAIPRTNRSRRLACERGQVIVMMALGLVMLLGLTSFVVDVGYILWARQALQASADAAATAGALDINVTGGNPTTKAQEYSAVTGNKNAKSALTNVTFSAVLKCINSTGLPTCTSPQVNAIVVTETATLPMYFARLIGINTKTITAKATATARGGAMPPLDIVVILDSSASMDDSCSSAVSGVGSPTKMDCAKAGVQELLLSLWPCAENLVTCGTADSSGNVTNPVDKVGIVAFPPLKASSDVSKTLDCTNNLSSSNMGWDNAAAKSTDPNYTYVLVPLSSDFKTSAKGTTLNAASNVVKATAVGNCGIEPEGMGSSFNTAFERANAELAANGRADVRDVIIFVSDGEGNYGPVYYDTATSSPETSVYRKRPCQSTVDLADTYAAAGKWIYSVAYDASGNCHGWSVWDGFHTTSGYFWFNESPTISAVNTMIGIASDSNKYFSQPTAGSLTAIFQKIGADLHTTRIVDDDID